MTVGLLVMASPPFPVVPLAIWLGAVGAVCMISAALSVLASNWATAKRFVAAIRVALGFGLALTVVKLVVIGCGYCCEYFPPWMCGSW